MKNTYIKLVLGIGLAATIATMPSCKKFVELGAPPTQVLYEDAFKTDASAQSVILGLYVSTTGSVTTNNILNMTTFYPGVLADDLKYNATDDLILQFANNAILNTNISVNNLWGSLFQAVKNTNNAIGGLNASTTLTSATKNQLLGEAKFLRAYIFFYLVNLYGDVPLPLKDDYSAFENAMLPRSSATLVYQQIVDDLKDAEDKLDAAYLGNFRGRVNKHAASAMLARVYLYLKDYPNAELYATKVLSATGYGMPAPSANFINTSIETIFQLATQNGVTTFANTYVTAATVVPVYSLSTSAYNSFESSSDLRRSNWVSPKTVSGQTYYAITKYKVSTGTGNEYHVVLRLAEQYLIRAEARAQQNNLTGAKTDLDAVRLRAGLGGVSSSLTQPQMLSAIEQERRVEFFGEFGHRWLDLKRTGRADALLGPIKPNWQSTDVLFPIPQAQRLINSSLTQNLGYE